VHWVDVVAERLLARGPSHRVASGTSISGVIHLGNAGDVIYADGIARALLEKGGEGRGGLDRRRRGPLRSIPEQMPPSFAEHLGKPVAVLPDPDGCHKPSTTMSSSPSRFALAPSASSRREARVAHVRRRE